MQKLVRAGNVVVLDEKNPHIRNIRDGTTIQLDANNGLYTVDMWVCTDGILLGMRNSAECFIGNADGVARAREVRKPGTSEQMGQRRHQQCDWSSLENDRRKMDSGQTRNSIRPDSYPSTAISKVRGFRGKESPSKTLRNSVPLSDAKVAMRSKTNSRAQAHSDRCRERIERCLRITPQGAGRLDRRNEVINEALAEEVRRADKRKTKVVDAAATVTEAEPATLQHEIQEKVPVEPDPDSKRRLLMKSAPSAASHS